MLEAAMSHPYERDKVGRRWRSRRSVSPKPRASGTGC